MLKSRVHYLAVALVATLSFVSSPAAAAPNYQKLCNGGNADACALEGDFRAKVDGPGSAMKWYRKAADLGHIGASFALGKSLIRTAGDDADKVGKALALLVAAADGGSERGKLWAGLVYFDGPKGTRDRTKAMAWLLPFAHKGDPNAQFCVAEMLYLGDGATKDHVQAASWFGLASAQGVLDASFKLGSMRAKGEGGAKDLVAANRWLDVAAVGGHPEARDAQRRVLTTLFKTTIDKRGAGALLEVGSYATSKGRKTFNTNGVGTYVIDDKVCYRFRWTYDTTRPDVIHTVRLNATKHCKTKGAKQSWMQVSVKDGVLTQLDVDPGASAFGDTVAPDPIVGERRDPADFRTLRFEADGTGAWRERNSLTDRMESHRFHWAHDIHRANHVHLVGTKNKYVNSWWLKLVGRELKRVKLGRASWMTHGAATPGEFAVRYSDFEQRWSFAGGKGSFIQRDPLEDAVECEATFRYEHAADGQLTINP
ncbi:MAG: hypothetical protein ACI9MR_000575, partial [Myxococcota bacterium]